MWALEAITNYIKDLICPSPLSLIERKLYSPPPKPINKIIISNSG